MQYHTLAQWVYMWIVYGVIIPLSCHFCKQLPVLAYGYSLVEPLSYVYMCCFQVSIFSFLKVILILFYCNMSKNNQTMGCTLSDKGKFGKDWIDKLDLSYVCHCFDGQILTCNCICKLLHEDLVAIKEYFKNLVDVFWIDDHHIANRTKQKK